MVRTESDSWDLATSVGATATMVAAQRALASERRLIDDPFAAPLVRAVGIDVYTRLVDGKIPVRGGSDFDPDRMARGMAVRTRFYDRYFLDAVQCGVRQAVILAAGLDARAYRLPWPAGTVVYEVDMPEVVEFKTSILQKLGAEPKAERRTVAVDLRDDWPAALQEAGFDSQVPAAWSAEGLVVYLPSEAQDALFDRITALSAAGSRLALEFVPDTAIFADERWRAHHERMAELGFDVVDFNELVYHGERGHIIEYLSRRGWQVSHRPVAQLHAENGFVYPDDDVAAAFADVTYLSAVLR
ncbi:class I SAM-dependent methyltransferase [Mycobacterium xenopi]|uniref:S-adenosyl-L-methionine-dependent methyltransferase n=1 Tax=Mycobacterium xenopi TaxID=1789 RepID=A0AAD1GXF5_MYCXE|nr:class I SAM-dependent methyltransferase [Mycobacterium xenopi]EID09680.1 putative S-adenosyl-L-methionine-dependent methyltransferase [Mycobacterium xenopi RIVM700367]MDA3641874.1 class I SAM-dependent methyltransferase [Mycobacterium xenopi]MDA3664147.1 class I SAM-dependent methyltransferase [Mycobacterium xenopi]ORX11381.1 SAM-dependent methyltransferase [Mycobacterium xenopi]SPX79122.1 putative S-adenosyl-L-methionine-dependent methyltransferase [Mycobacterium xenopi]